MGVHLSELLNLRLGACDLAGKRRPIFSGKGDRDRLIPHIDYLISLQQQAYLVSQRSLTTDHLLICKVAAVNLISFPSACNVLDSKLKSGR
jgi:site-specific recombinase XerD